MLVLCFQLSLSSILSLTGKELELVCKAQQFCLDIVGISSAKCSGFGTVELNGGWKIIYSVADAAMFVQAGVGLLVSPNMAESIV